MDYIAYIKSPQWKSRSRLYRNTHPRCELCGCNDRFKLQTHHISYRNIGNEPDEDLMTLCRDCHEVIEEIKSYKENITPIVPLLTKITELDNRSIAACGRGVRVALGSFYPIYDRIMEFSPRRYKFTEDIASTSEYAKIEAIIEKWCEEFRNKDGIIDVEYELQKPEITLPHNDFPLWDVSLWDAEGVCRTAADRVCFGINGIDERVTYLKSSCDDLYDAASLIMCSYSDYITDNVLHALRAYCVKVNNLYANKYPRLARNARIVGVVLHGQSCPCYD